MPNSHGRRRRRRDVTVSFVVSVGVNAA